MKSIAFLARLIICTVLCMHRAALAQSPIPKPVTLDGAALFRNQCSACHSVNPAEPPRQGPLLKGVVGRPVGSVPGFKYTAGFSSVSFVWDADHLDAWLTNPQSVIPGANMPYRQANPEMRRKIIGYLQDPK